MFIYKIEARRLLMIASSLLALAWVSGPLEAAPLTISTTQIVPQAANLVGVACGQTCHAVGSGFGNDPVVIADIGGQNLGEFVPPDKNHFLSFKGIACPPAPANQTCYAVGQLTEGTVGNQSFVGVVVPITTRASGDIIGTPVSVNGTANLSAVACPSETACYAVGVGNSTFSFGPVLVALDPPGLGSPEVKPAPTIALAAGLESVGVTLQGIACPTTRVCNAIGNDLIGSNSAGFENEAVRFKIEIPSLTVSGGHGHVVNGVAATQASGIACLSTDICYAVAVSSQNPFQGAVVPIVNGNAGTVQVVDIPNNSALNAVACVPNGDCFAVGGGSVDAGPLQDVVVPILDGNLDSAGAAVLPQGDVLFSIACKEDFCYSVGSVPVGFGTQGLLASFVVRTVSEVSPSKGPWTGGTVVTITGTGFGTLPGDTVFGVQSLDGEFVDPLPLTDVVCSSSTTCTGTMPEWPLGGEVAVTATVIGFPSLTNGAFTYSSPPHLGRP